MRHLRRERHNRSVKTPVRELVVVHTDIDFLADLSGGWLRLLGYACWAVPAGLCLLGCASWAEASCTPTAEGVPQLATLQLNMEQSSQWVLLPLSIKECLRVASAAALGISLGPPFLPECMHMACAVMIQP